MAGIIATNTGQAVMKAITLASASAIDQRVTSTVLGPGSFWSAIFWDKQKKPPVFLVV